MFVDMRFSKHGVASVFASVSVWFAGAQDCEIAENKRPLTRIHNARVHEYICRYIYISRFVKM